MGGSLNPDYFRKNINLAVMTGPVACTANIPTEGIRLAAKNIKEIQFFFVHVIHVYNVIAPMPLAEEALTALCSFVPFLCKAAAEIASSEVAVDNLERYPMYLANVPSGVSYRTFVYYA